MKKTKNILAIATLSTIGLGALTLATPQTVEAQTDIFSTLDRIESYANMTYDFQNPENMFLNDDYYLFYDGTNYLNTGIQLFSNDNSQKDFEVSFVLESLPTDQTNYAVIFGDINENS